jgi:hypothetical protein
MAAGDLITQDWQFEFNGLLLGPSTVYDLDKVEGLDLIAVREGDVARPYDHGRFDLAPDVLPGRIVEITGEVISSTWTDVTALSQALKDREGTLPLVFRTPDGTLKRINCRCRRRKVPITASGTALSTWEFGIMFWAPDPRIYANNASQQTVSPASTTEAADFEDWGFDLAFGVAVAGSVICNNAGNIETRPTVTFYGPMTNPVLSNTTTGIVWSSNINLSGGETLVVDFDAKTLLLNGVTDRYSYFTGQWWTLVPGDNVIELAVSAGSGTAQISWRSAWDSVV